MENANWWNKGKNRNRSFERPNALTNFVPIGSKSLNEQRDKLVATQAVNSALAFNDSSQAALTGSVEEKSFGGDAIQQQAFVFSRVSEYKNNPAAFERKYGPEAARLISTVSKQLEVSGFNAFVPQQDNTPQFKEYTKEEDLKTNPSFVKNDDLTFQQKSSRFFLQGSMSDAEYEKWADEYAKKNFADPDARFLGYPIGKVERDWFAVGAGLKGGGSVVNFVPVVGNAVALVDTLDSNFGISLKEGKIREGGIADKALKWDTNLADFGTATFNVLMTTAVPVMRDPIIQSAIMPVLNSITQTMQSGIGSATRTLPTGTGKVNKALDNIWLSDLAELSRSPSEKSKEIKAEVENAKDIFSFGESEYVSMSKYYDIVKTFPDFTEEYRKKMTERYGAMWNYDDPFTLAATSATFITWSSPEARLNAALRIWGGEDPEVVLQGASIPEGAFSDESELFVKRARERVTSAGRVAMIRARYMNPAVSDEILERVRSDAEQEAAEKINAEGFVRGEEDPLAQLAGDFIVSSVAAELTVGEIATKLSKIPKVGKYISKVIVPPTEEAVRLARMPLDEANVATRFKRLWAAGEIPLDPLQKINLGDIFNFKNINKLNPRTSAARVVEKLSSVFNPNDESHVRRLQSIISGNPEWMMNLSKKLSEKKDPTAPEKVMTWALNQVIKTTEYTKAARANISTGFAIQILAPLLSDARSVVQARERLSAFMNAPETLTEKFGNMPVSLKAKIAKLGLEGVNFGDFLSLKGSSFDYMRFLHEAEQVVSENSRSAFGVLPVKDRPPIERFIWNFKRVAGEFWLRTPGYVARNLLSDNAMIALDGWNAFENAQAASKYLQEFGIATQSIVANRGGFSSEVPSQVTSIFDKVPILKHTVAPLNNLLQKTNDKLEFGRRMKVFNQAFKLYWEKKWKPSLNENAIALLGPDFGYVWNELQDNLLHVRKYSDIQAAVEKAISKRTSHNSFVFSQALKNKNIDPRYLSEEMRMRIDDGLAAIELRGGSEKDISDFFDNLVKENEVNRAEILRATGKTYVDSDDVMADSAADLNIFDTVTKKYVEFLIKNGVSKEDAQKQAEELISKIKSDEQSVLNARVEMGGILKEVMKRLGRVPDKDFLFKIGQIISWAYDEEYRLRGEGRREVDVLDKQTWEATEGKPTTDSRAMWNEYRNKSSKIWGDKTQQIADVHKSVSQMLVEFGASYIEGTHEKWWKDAAAKNPFEKTLFGAIGDLEIVKAMERVSTSAEREEFWKRLEETRFAFDIYRRDLYRQAFVWVNNDPHAVIDAFNVIRNAERNVVNSVSRTLAEKMRLLALKDSKNITLEGYMTKVNEAWANHYNYAVEVMQKIAPSRMVWSQVTNSPIAVLLRKAGKSNEEIFDIFSKAVVGSTHDEAIALVKAAINDFSPEKIKQFLLVAEAERARRLYGDDVAAAVLDGSMTFTDGTGTVATPNRQRVVKYLREQFSGLGNSEFNAAVAIADARAEAFSKRTGKSVDEWWATRLATEKDVADLVSSAGATSSSPSSGSGVPPSGSPPVSSSVDPSVPPDTLSHRRTKVTTGKDTALVRSGSVEFLSDGRAVIRAGAAYDVTTMVHELAHVFERDLKAETPVLWDETLNQFGTKQADGTIVWDVDSRERFAASFEVYLQKGVAPTAKLLVVFKAFSRWVTSIFKRFTSKDRMALSPEMQRIYDSLLDAEIMDLAPKSPDAVAADAADAAAKSASATADATGTTADATGTTADATGTTADATGTTADATGTTADATGTTADAPGTTASPKAAPANPALAKRGVPYYQWNGMVLDSEVKIKEADLIFNLVSSENFMKDSNNVLDVLNHAQKFFSREEFAYILRQASVENLANGIFSIHGPRARDAAEAAVKKAEAAFFDGLNKARISGLDFLPAIDAARAELKNSLVDFIGNSPYLNAITETISTNIVSTFRYVDAPRSLVDPSARASTITGDKGAELSPSVKRWFESDEPNQMFAFKSSDGGLYKVYYDPYGEFHEGISKPGFVYKKWGGVGASEPKTFAVVSDAAFQKAINDLVVKIKGQLIANGVDRKEADRMARSTIGMFAVEFVDNDYVRLVSTGEGWKVNVAFKADAITPDLFLKNNQRLVTGNEVGFIRDWQKIIPLVKESELVYVDELQQAQTYSYPSVDEKFGTFYFEDPPAGATPEEMRAFNLKETQEIIRIAQETKDESVILASDEGSGFVIVHKNDVEYVVNRSSDGRVWMGKRKPDAKRTKKASDWVVSRFPVGINEIFETSFSTKSDAIWYALRSRKDGTLNDVYTYRLVLPETQNIIDNLLQKNVGSGVATYVGTEGIAYYSFSQAVKAMLVGQEKADPVFKQWVSYAKMFLDSHPNESYSELAKLYGFLSENGIDGLKKILSLSDKDAVQLVFGVSDPDKADFYAISSINAIREVKFMLENPDDFASGKIGWGEHAGKFREKKFGLEDDARNAASEAEVAAQIKADQEAEAAAAAAKAAKKKETKPKKVSPKQARQKVLNDLAEITNAVKEGRISLSEALAQANKILDDSKHLYGSTAKTLKENLDIMRAMVDASLDGVGLDNYPGRVLPEENNPDTPFAKYDQDFIGLAHDVMQTFREGIATSKIDGTKKSVYEILKGWTEKSSEDEWIVAVDKYGRFKPDGSAAEDGDRFEFVNSTNIRKNIDQLIAVAETSSENLSPKMNEIINKLKELGTEPDNAVFKQADFMLSAIDGFRADYMLRADSEGSMLPPTLESREIMARRLSLQYGPVGLSFGVKEKDAVTRTAYIEQVPSGYSVRLTIHDGAASEAVYVFDTKYKALKMALAFGEGLDAFVNTTAVEQSVQAKKTLRSSSKSKEPILKKVENLNKKGGPQEEFDIENNNYVLDPNRNWKNGDGFAGLKSAVEATLEQGKYVGVSDFSFFVLSDIRSERKRQKKIRRFI